MRPLGPLSSSVSVALGLHVLGPNHESAGRHGCEEAGAWSTAFGRLPSHGGYEHVHRPALLTVTSPTRSCQCAPSHGRRPSRVGSLRMARGKRASGCNCKTRPYQVRVIMASLQLQGASMHRRRDRPSHGHGDAGGRPGNAGAIKMIDTSPGPQCASR